MATVMASPRRPSGGNLQAQSNVTHVRMGHVSHQSNNIPTETAPPLPSRPIRRQAFETNSFIDRNTARAFSDPNNPRTVERSQSEASQHHYQQQQHSAHAGSATGHGPTSAQSRNPTRQRQPKPASDVAPPPPPASRPPTRPPPQYETAPPPPPTSRPPGRKQSHADQGAPAPAPVQDVPAGHTTRRQPHNPGVPAPVPVQAVQAGHTTTRQPHTPEVPPALPPSRPPKTSHSSNSSSESAPSEVHSRPPKGRLQSAHSVDETQVKQPKSRAQPPAVKDDFESRYRFHDVSDFPEPETSDVSPNKMYPSQSVSVKKKSRKVKDDQLGPL